MEKVIPKLMPMTPYEVYTSRVSTTYDNIRKTRQGFAYTPMQYGGLFGQGVVANSGDVLEVMEFEVK